jgi:hypothetical protein
VARCPQLLRKETRVSTGTAVYTARWQGRQGSELVFRVYHRLPGLSVGVTTVLAVTCDLPGLGQRPCVYV